MTHETIHILALTATDRLWQAIVAACKADDAGATYDLSPPYKRDGMYCVDITIYSAEVAA